jgi:hypothetical protein
MDKAEGKAALIYTFARVADRPTAAEPSGDPCVINVAPPQLQTCAPCTVSRDWRRVLDVLLDEYMVTARSGAMPASGMGRRVRVRD